MAFEAAEKAYRINWTEYGRLAVKGGATKPTEILLNTSTGQYLADNMESLRSIKKRELSVSSPGLLAWIKPIAYGDAELVLQGCEDYRNSRLTDADGKPVTPSGTRVYQQEITVQKVEGRWKLADQVTSEVEQC